MDVGFGGRLHGTGCSRNGLAEWTVLQCARLPLGHFVFYVFEHGGCGVCSVV